MNSQTYGGMIEIESKRIHKATLLPTVRDLIKSLICHVTYIRLEASIAIVVLH